MTGRLWRRGAALVTAVLVLLSSGCWDFRQLNERAFVLMIGIDRGPQGKGYHVTTQKIIGQYLAGAQAGGGGTGGGQPHRPWIIREADGDSLMAAVEKIRMTIHRDLEFAHLKVIVLGEDVAREDDLTNLDPFARALKFPNTAFVAVARGKAADVVSAPNQAEDVPALYVFHGYTGRYARTQAILAVPAWYALDRTLMNPLQDTVAGGLGLDKGEVNFAGAALWRGLRMVGWLDPHDTKLVSFYLGLKQVDDYLTTPGDVGESLRIATARGRYWADWDPDGTVVLHLTASLAGDLVGSDQPVITLEDQAQVEARLAATTRQNIEKFLHQLQAVGSDPLGFGEKLREVDPTAPEVQTGEAWHSAYAKARVQVTATVKIYNRGYMR